MPKRPRCSKCRRRPVRAADQRYCRECNAAMQRVYRKRLKRELNRLRKVEARHEADS